MFCVQFIFIFLWINLFQVSYTYMLKYNPKMQNKRFFLTVIGGYVNYSY